MRGFPYSLSCPLFRFTARNDLRVCRWLLCFALLTGPWFSMRINDEKRGVNALRRESQVSRLLTFFCLCSARPLCSFGPPPRLCSGKMAVLSICTLLVCWLWTPVKPLTFFSSHGRAINPFFFSRLWTEGRRKSTRSVYVQIYTHLLQRFLPLLFWFSFLLLLLKRFFFFDLFHRCLWLLNSYSPPFFFKCINRFLLVFFRCLFF